MAEERTASRRVPRLAVLILGQYLLIAAYAVLAFVPGGQLLPDESPRLDRLVLAPIPPITIALLVMRGRRQRRDRRWAYVLAAACAVFAAANFAQLLLSTLLGASVVGVTEGLYLAAYVLGAVAVADAVRLFGARPREGMVVEAILSGLAALSVGALLVHPLLEDSDVEPLRTAVLSLYVFLNLVLLAVLAASVAVGGGFHSPAHVGLTSGLTVLVLVGFLYAQAIVHENASLVPLIDVGWALSLTLLGQGAWFAWDRAPRPPRIPGDMASLLVTSLAISAGVVVLTICALIEVPWYVVLLAAATVLAGGVRTAMAMWRLRELVELRHQARTDDLTGLLNRRGFYQEVERLLERRRDDEIIGVGLLDFDRFKRLNDTRGHDAGDAVLATFGVRARVAAAVQPCRVTVARLGGDEFAMVVAGVSSFEEVEASGRAVTEAARIAYGDDEADVVTATAGLAVAPRHGTTRVTLMRAADRAMYAAKQAGRDRVRLYDGELHGADAGTPPVRG